MGPQHQPGAAEGGRSPIVKCAEDRQGTELSAHRGPHLSRCWEQSQCREIEAWGVIQQQKSPGRP